MMLWLLASSDVDCQGSWYLRVDRCVEKWGRTFEERKMSEGEVGQYKSGIEMTRNLSYGTSSTEHGGIGKPHAE